MALDNAGLHWKARTGNTGHRDVTNNDDVATLRKEAGESSTKRRTPTGRISPRRGAVSVRALRNPAGLPMDGLKTRTGAKDTTDHGHRSRRPQPADH
jgi:hypothetical protein